MGKTQLSALRTPITRLLRISFLNILVFLSVFLEITAFNLQGYESVRNGVHECNNCNISDIPTERNRIPQHITHIILTHNITTIPSRVFHEYSTCLQLAVMGNSPSMLVETDAFLGMDSLEHLRLVDDKITHLPPGSEHCFGLILVTIS